MTIAPLLLISGLVCFVLAAIGIKGYLLNVLLAIDIFGSAILGGMPGETLSGRAGTAQREGKWRGRFWVPIIDFLMRNPRHCEMAIQGDVLRAKAVILDDSRV